MFKTKHSEVKKETLIHWSYSSFILEWKNKGEQGKRNIIWPGIKTNPNSMATTFRVH